MRPVRDQGFTLLELLIVIAVIGIISAIAVPNLLAARISGNEASAIGSIRAILSAEADYQGLNRGFAVDLAALAATCPNMSAPFIAGDLNANGVSKSGYVLTLAPGAGAAVGPNDCNGTATQTAFYVSASPFVVGLSGNRGFASNAASAIWQDTTGAPPTEPFTLGGTVSLIGQ